VRSQVGWAPCKARREARVSPRAAASMVVFRREQTPACTVASLHVGVSVILTAKAPNRHRSSRPFDGRNDAGPRSRNTGERKWTRPQCSSSSSWCCCSAAVDSSTDAGFEFGRAVRSPESLAPLRHVHRVNWFRRGWRGHGRNHAPGSGIQVRAVERRRPPAAVIRPRGSALLAQRHAV
jgi:hypothetical protein